MKNHSHRRSRGQTLTAAMLPVLCGFGSLPAATVLYSFEGLQFPANSQSPFMDRKPNSGSNAFEIDFVSNATSAGFQIAAFQPNPLFSGQMMYDPQPPSDVLRLTFNQLVDRVEIDFAIVEPGGRLTLTSSGGTFSQAATDVGGDFQGGTLIYTAAGGISGFQLQAFNGGNAATLFAFDNVRLNVVPEPAAAVLLAAGSLAAGMRRRRKFRSS